jgi:phosphoserine phosphatase RsbU/P
VIRAPTEEPPTATRRGAVRGIAERLGFGRGGFPLRVHIATLFLALMASAGLALVGYGYVATSHLLLSAGDEEFLHVAERTAGHVRDLLAPAHLVVQLLARHRLTETVSLNARLETLPLLTTALAEHPEISAIYVGFAGGDFFLVRSLHDAVRQQLQVPAGAVFLVQSRASAEDGAGGRYLFLDARLGVVRDESRPDYRFDPRTREWYRQAMASSGSVRTSPYVFFTTREVGTTLARRSADGASVAGVDITLQDLSRRMARSRVTPSARMALVDRQGLVIAHPDVDQLVRISPDGAADVTRLDDLRDAALGALFSAAVSGERGTPLRIDGKAWIGMRRSIAADAGDPLTLLLAAPRAELVAQARGLAQRQLLIGLGVLGVTLGLVWLSARRISRPLEELSRSVVEIGRGNLDTALPEIWNPVEVRSLIDVTDRMRVELRDHIEARAARLAEEQRRAQELDIARQIQQSMLPSLRGEPLDARCVIAATLQPAREVGGDLYDFFLLDGRRLVFIIGDVTDKGVPAALLMARVTGLFRAIAQGGMDPDGLLRELDTRLSEGNDTCMFVTAACGALDAETGELWYASAGHDRPLLRRVDGTTAVLLLEGGPALGLDMNLRFPLWTGHLAPGDALVLCTDGATEAFDAGGVAFGLERVRRVVADTPADALGSLPPRLVEAIEQFSEGGGPRDDLAVFAVQYRPSDVEVSGLGGEAWRLSVSSEPEDTARAQRRIEAILRARDVPAAVVHDCSLAAEEVLTNIAKHAYGGAHGSETHIEVRLLREEIQVRFEDAGPPFNPLEQPDPDLDAPPAGQRAGGRGLVLLKHLVERCEYARKGDANVLITCWGRPAAPASEAALTLTEHRARGGAMALEIGITSQEPAGRRLTLRGRLDTLTTPQLETELAPLLAAPEVMSLVFQLDELEYISSAGIRCVIRANKALADRGGGVAIVNPQATVRGVFEIVKALPPGQILASEPELAAYLDAMRRTGREGP